MECVRNSWGAMLYFTIGACDDLGVYGPSKGKLCEFRNQLQNTLPGLHSAAVVWHAVNGDRAQRRLRTGDAY